MLRSTLFAVALSLFAAPSFADGNEGIGFIEGPTLKLVYGDHVLSGAIGNRMLYAVPFADKFGMTVQHRHLGQDFTGEFSKIENVATFKLTSTNPAGEREATTVAITGVNAEEGVINGTIDGAAYTVKVTSETMEGNHYVDPTFTVTKGDQVYSFKLNGGKACIGCALKISTVVVAFLKVDGTLL